MTIAIFLTAGKLHMPTPGHRDFVVRADQTYRDLGGVEGSIEILDVLALNGCEMTRKRAVQLFREEM